MDKLHSYSCRVCKEEIPIDEDFNLETPNYLFPLCVDCCGDIEEEIRGIVDRTAKLKEDVNALTSEGGKDGM